ncbi:MAG: class I SAM-dependent methyltransferase, partial [Mesorhizobium sp.]
PSLLPDDAEDAPQGAIVELAPARAALMGTIAERIAGHGGAGLFIDYGHLRPGIGDTLQALRKHDHDNVLANPGEADLTAHVDFAALAATARAHGLDVETTTQGDFLLGMG